MSDLLKRLNFTVGAGVIGPGSSHHEYHVAESQVREAMSRIQALQGRCIELEAKLAALEAAHERRGEELERLLARVYRDPSVTKQRSGNA